MSIEKDFIGIGFKVGDKIVVGDREGVAPFNSSSSFGGAYIYNKKEEKTERIEVGYKGGNLVGEIGDLNKLNKSKLGFFEVKKNGEIKNVEYVENSNIPYNFIKEIQMDFRVNIPGINDCSNFGLKDKNSFIRSNSLDHSYKNNKKAVEVKKTLGDFYEEIRLKWKENNGLKLSGNIFSGKILDKNGETIPYKLKIDNSGYLSISFNLKTDSELSKFISNERLRGYSSDFTNDLIGREDFDLISEKIIKDISLNKNVIDEKINNKIKTNLYFYEGVYGKASNSDFLIKEKKVIDYIKNQIFVLKDKMKEGISLDQTEIVREDFDIGDYIRTGNISNNVDIDNNKVKEKFSQEQIMDILGKKIKQLGLTDSDRITELKEKVLNKKLIKKPLTLKREKFDKEGKVIVESFNVNVDNVFKNLEDIKINEKISNKQVIKEKIGVNKIKENFEFNNIELSLKNRVDYSNEVERSDSYAESLDILSIMQNKFKEINDFDLNESNKVDFKKLLLDYKVLSDDLSAKYSGEGGLIMTKKVVSNLLTYVNLNLADTTELENNFYKDFLHSNMKKVLSDLFESEEIKRSTTKRTIVESELNSFRKITLKDESLYSLSKYIEKSLNVLEDSKIDFSLLSGNKISNIEGRGAYYTPTEFGNFMKPFIQETSNISGVTVLDTSVGKGTLLDFFEGDNVKKIGNDINPISLNVFKHTQSLEIDKMLKEENLNKLIQLKNTNNLISTYGSSIDYLDHDIKVDYFMSNAPYINSVIGGKEREEKLRDKKIKTSLGRVNMVELNYRGLADKINLGGFGMNISSARGIGKIERKFNLNDGTYLVPLYRIGVNGRPFKNEGVDLAPIEIVGDNTYTYSDGKLSNGSDTAEFFTTIYTRVDKKNHNLFGDEAPTILMDYKDIEGFNNFVLENYDKNNVLFNYKQAFGLNHKYKLDKITELTGDKIIHSIENSIDLNKATFEGIVSRVSKDTLNDFTKKQSLSDFKIDRIKYLKPQNAIYLKIKELLNGVNKINIDDLSLFKEGLKGFMNETSLKIILKNELGLEHNGYSFKLLKDSKVKKINGKFFLGDKDITGLLKNPFPFSLHTVPLNTYTFIFEKYLSNLSTDENFINKKVLEIEDYITTFSSLEKKRTLKVVNEIGNINSTKIAPILAYIIKHEDKILKGEKRILDLLAEKAIKFDSGINLFQIENFLLYLNNNPSEFRVIEKNMHKESFQNKIKGVYKKFPKGISLKTERSEVNSLSEQSLSSLFNYIKKVENKHGTDNFKNILVEKDGKLGFINENNIFNKYSSNIQLLEKLGEFLLKEKDLGNDYFYITDGFKDSKSILLQEFSRINMYKKFNQMTKLDDYFYNLDELNVNLDLLNKDVNFYINRISGSVDFNSIKNQLKDSFESSERDNIRDEDITDGIKKYFKDNYEIHENEMIQLKKALNGAKNQVEKIEIKEIKDLYLININKLEKNIGLIKDNEINIDEIISRISRNVDFTGNNYYFNGDDLDKLEFLEKLVTIGDHFKEKDLYQEKLLDVREILNKNILSDDGIYKIGNSFQSDNIIFKKIGNEITDKYNYKSTFNDYSKKFYEKKLNNELSFTEESNSMLLDVYTQSAQKKLKERVLNETVYIDDIIYYYQSVESSYNSLKNSDKANPEKLKEMESDLSFTKFMASNVDENTKIILLDYLKGKNSSTPNIVEGFDEFYLSKSHAIYTGGSKDKIKNIISEKFKDYNLYGKETAEGIIMNLGIKSSYLKVYTNLLLDIESDLLLENGDSIFSKEYLDFKKLIDKVSPFEEKIKLSTSYADNLEYKGFLSKRAFNFLDVSQIPEIKDYFNSLGIDDEKELVAILKTNKDLIKEVKDGIDLRIKDIEAQLEVLKTTDPENKEKMYPTFMQSKSLFKFQKSLNEHDNGINLLNQSEVGTGKTFTLPFYEEILENKFNPIKKNKEAISSKKLNLFITEANLVSNTTKSLIENGKSPSEVFEGKLSKEEDVFALIDFIKKGGENIILSSHALHSLDKSGTSLFMKYLGKNIDNIYMYSDEATFLKNTESSSYAGFQFIKNGLEKTKKLRLANYLTATPVNNDNGDFLYLLNLFNKKDMQRMINEKNSNLSEKGKHDLYRLLNDIKNLRSGIKVSHYLENGNVQYFFIPKMVLLLEFIRTGNEKVLDGRFNLFDMTERLDVYGKEETITKKKYYEELGMPIKQIAYDEFLSKNNLSDDYLMLNSNNKDLTFDLIEIYKNLNIINFDRNLNSIGFNGQKSTLLKTYYSLKPSLIEGHIIDSFLKEISKIQKFKKFSNIISKVNNKGMHSISDELNQEGSNVFKNLLIDLSLEKGIENFGDETYSVKRKVKKGFKEVEESTTYKINKLKTSDVIDLLESETSGDFILGSELIDSFCSNIDVIAYSKYKDKIKEINLLREKGVKDTVIKKEESNADKYLNQILSVVQNFSGLVITSNTRKEDFIERLKNKYVNDDFIESVKGTYMEDQEGFVRYLGNYMSDNQIRKESNKKEYDILNDLAKQVDGISFSERKYVIQLLEDFNSPLSNLFIEKAIKNIVTNSKEDGLNIDMNEKDLEKIKEYIVSKGNTLSGTLINIAGENSKKEINSFITVNFVNTVENLEKEIGKLNKDIYKITGKTAPSSKEKLKIINDFDKLDNFGKNLVATTKSVEKGLSIFNGLKLYTVVGDENAGALTQRIGRYRTLMTKQMNNLSKFKTDINSGKLDFGKRNKQIVSNIDRLLTNNKEAFILGNKLSEGLLQSSESKTTLLSNVNATSMFNGLIDFNDKFYGLDFNNFSIDNVVGGIDLIIKGGQEKFVGKLKNYGENVDGKVFFHEIKQNIENNIKYNLKNLSILEGIKIPNENELNDINSDLGLS